jgi:hypothetical protein
MTILPPISSLTWNQDGELSTQDHTDLLEILAANEQVMTQVVMHDSCPDETRTNSYAARQTCRCRPSRSRLNTGKQRKLKVFVP